MIKIYTRDKEDKKFIFSATFETERDLDRLLTGIKEESRREDIGLCSSDVYLEECRLAGGSFSLWFGRTTDAQLVVMPKEKICFVSTANFHKSIQNTWERLAKRFNIYYELLEKDDAENKEVSSA